MNMLAEFCLMIEGGLEWEDFKAIADDGKRDKYALGLAATKIRTRYRKSEDKFSWYLSLSIDEADRLYMQLLRRAGERQMERKAKRLERRGG